MRITKELFEQLSKKEQKEFFERKEKIYEETKPFSFTFTIGKAIIYIFLFSLIVLPLWKLAFSPELFFNVARMFIIIFRVLLSLAFPVAVCIDLICILLSIYKLNKLKNKYFKIEIKKRRK